jgi:ribosomal protein S18 acetylase RimI-like enzyme
MGAALDNEERQAGYNRIGSCSDTTLCLMSGVAGSDCMSKKLLQGIVIKKILDHNEIASIQKLATLCEEHEPVHLHISWGMLEMRPGDFPLDFLYYDGGQIVGYLGLNDCSIENKELFGVVHPAYRRQGIFRALFRTAEEVCRQRAVRRLIFICERTSLAGQAFVKALGTVYNFSEHEMVLTDFRTSVLSDKRLSLQRATIQDIDALISIQEAAFGDRAGVVRQRIASWIACPFYAYYLAFLKSNKGEPAVPIGSLRLELDDEIGIYAFGVHPVYQGRGYGRQMLEQMIYHLRATPALCDKVIMLEVATNNVRAINLYRSCGFQVRTSYDYYSYPL